ncbi:MAG: hypothetical protein HUJ91_08085 [Bacteroidales bacterium]|nr:hypothetical protein [Bacteroidales bacterium]
MPINTKMAMAIVGVCIAGYNMARQQIGGFRKDLLRLTVWALLISGFSFFAIVVNNTPDDTYVTYFISMWVWIGGAYTLVSWTKWVHGKASILIIGNYLAAVCVIQCALALAIDSSPFFHRISVMIQGPQLWLESVDRLYGIGAALDTAGVRFSLTLVVLAYIISHINEFDEKYSKWLPAYWIAFFVITIVGNIVARTTIVGVALGLLYIVVHTVWGHVRNSRIWKWFLIILLATVPITSFFYKTNGLFRENFEFGFEGFISLIETGKWQVGSNDQLANMVVFPDNTKTWLIGDGYIVNPKDIDEYYTGEITEGYYKNTDIGYLRFIFYFGIFGLIAFCLYFIVVTKNCCKRMPRYRDLFILFCLVNYIVWFKVATDEFIIFALMLMIDPRDCEPEPELIEES